MGQLNVPPRTIYCCDNIDVLRGINDGCIDLIYLDPPFNKNKKFSAPIGSSTEGAEFSDIFREKDIKDEWVDEIRQENYQLHEFLRGVRTFGNKYNYCYLVYMAIRLLEMKRILKVSGSLYLHCDSTMSHYIKLMMDSIFEEANFRNEISWCYDKWTNATKRWQRNHDSLFFYTKSNSYTFNRQYKMTDHKQRVLERGWDSNKIDRTKRQLLVYDWNKAAAEAKKAKYDVVVDCSKKPLGTAISDHWSDIEPLSSGSKERVGYPTQKPIKLLGRIIEASSNKGDTVLDPFCGCATTCVAAEKLERNWIGVDVSHKAYELVKERLEREVEGLLAEDPNYRTDPPTRGKQSTRDKKYVYVISNPNYPNEYKVGVSKDVRSRLNQYQTSDPNRGYKLEYSQVTANFTEIEKYIHKKFDARHEWVKGDAQGIIDEIKRYKPKNQL